jgi:hypothetical protein
MCVADLDKILALLPALQRPTISSSATPTGAVNTIIEERTVRDRSRRLARWWPVDRRVSAQQDRGLA